LLGLFLPEAALRWLLFSSSELALSWAGELRNAHNFADSSFEDEYWLLRWVLEPGESKHRSPTYDARLGWINDRFDARTRRPLTVDELPGRRPLLMFGASYVACMTKPKECFEGLMRQSDIARQYYPVNYGVGGYGIDQVYLLLRESLDLFAGENPLVVIGVVLDSDLERCVLGFRSWPKPRFELREGRLVEPGPVFAGGSQAFLDQHGIGITSYAWRYLLHGKHQLAGPWRERVRGVAAQQSAQDELIDALLSAMRAELESRGLEYFFVLFTSPRGLPPAEVPAQERRLTRLFLDEGVPFVHARPYLLQAGESREGGLDSLFSAAGPAMNHPNAEGNRVLFEALRDGLEGRFTTQAAFP
jgi:hypothetical protein